MSDFLDAFTAQTHGLTHVSVGRLRTCDECGCSIADDHRDGLSLMTDEGHFSWNPCDTCNSPLGGNRYAAHGIITGKDVILHLNVCVDCLTYSANGDLPQPE